MLARFQNTLADTIVKAAIIASAGLPYTLVMALMAAALVILTIQSYLSILIMASFWLLFGFSLVAYVDVIFYLRVFRRFTAKEDLPKEEEGQLSATPEF
jgi:membrane protein implicated in regulation of membrane protease activity